jgi:predicted porin
LAPVLATPVGITVGARLRVGISFITNAGEANSPGRYRKTRGSSAGLEFGEFRMGRKRGVADDER